MADTSDDELLQIDDCVKTWSRKMSSASDLQRLHNAISTNVTNMNSKTTDLENLVKKIGTPEDSEQLRERYLRLQNEAKALMEKINNEIKSLPHGPAGSDEQRKTKAFIDNISKQYLKICNRFIEAQRIGARKEKESLNRAQSVSQRQPGIHNPQFVSDEFPSSTYQTQQQQVVISLEQHVDMDDLKKRSDDIRQLETNIVEVAELFKDVQDLVQGHGEIIDNIVDHVEDTQTNVEVANVNLKKAVEYQTAARRKKIMLFLILFIVIVIIALILGIYFGVKK